MTSLTATSFGKLFIIATPIGNLKDMTLRAIETLQSVDLIAAEDTRHSHPLLQHFGISKPILSLHQHNESHRTTQILEKLREGVNIALISDAGTPLISDPGFTLVQSVRAQGFSVIPIPGACALITALSAAGLPCDHFFFAGFLPHHAGNRQKILKTYQDTPYTTVFYESPHRILALFQDIQAIFGPEKPICFAKELTKLFEFFLSGTIQEAIAWLEEKPEHKKGEFVVMLPGTAIEKTDTALFTLSLEAILKPLLATLPLKQAVQLAAEITGKKKNAVYDIALNLKT